MKTFNYVVAAISLAGCNSAAHADPTKLKSPEGNQKPRNVVFILSDDHRYDYMGFMGKVPWLKTPNMDRMAAEGAHIKNAFCYHFALFSQQGIHPDRSVFTYSQGGGQLRPAS